MQAENYNLFDWIVIFFGPSIVLFFTFYLLWSGRRKNRMIMEKTRSLLLQAFEEEFEDLVFDQVTSNGGILYPRLNPKGNFPFKNFRVIFALEERHLMLSVLIALFSGSEDYMALEADIKGSKIVTKFQILPKHENSHIQKYSDLLFSLEDIKLDVKQIDDNFVMRASSKRVGYAVLADKEVLRKLYHIKDYLVRISVDSSDDPSYRIYVRIKEGLDIIKLKDFFYTFGKRLASYGSRAPGSSKRQK